MKGLNYSPRIADAQSSKGSTVHHTVQVEPSKRAVTKSVATSIKKDAPDPAEKKEKALPAKVVVKKSDKKK